MTFRCAPLAAWRITLRDLRGPRVTLSVVPTLLRAAGNPFCALRRPPVERCGVTGADPRSLLPWEGQQALHTDCRLESCTPHREHNGEQVL